MATRQEVFTAIESECACQDSRCAWGGGKDHEIASWILYMQHQLDEARRLAATTFPETVALDAIRKCVTLGVRCMEEHGAPLR